PEALGALKELTILHLDDNKLTGHVLRSQEGHFPCLPQVLFEYLSLEATRQNRFGAAVLSNMLNLPEDRWMARGLVCGGHE
ncbi:unnamed protein product, partial [Ectocarpus sp. 12 AP-2014]